MRERREFLKWSCRLTGGYLALCASSEIPPLRRVNTTLFAQAHAAEPCTQDTCSQQDNCGTTDTAGHTCEQRDVCTVDASGDCTNDQCETDKSLKCTSDACTSDKSGECQNDTCKSDASGGCKNDQCTADSSGSCRGDTCETDKSAACVNDTCKSDIAGSCRADSCTSDKSGECVSDTCTSDKSQSCKNDTCTSDKSGSGQNDRCVADSSGACQSDRCSADLSGECQNDTCKADKSAACTEDTCTSDKSAWCSSDQCATDKSARCVSDECESDKSGCSSDVCEEDSIGCRADRCNSDYSNACEKDVCVLDLSTVCSGDVCREDRSPSDCTASDSCVLDLAFDFEASRRDLARMGFNKAMKWLYKLVMVLAFLALTHGLSHARTVIDSSNAQFYPSPSYLTKQAVSVPDPVGPFLSDCDDDGVLEADTNGDGQCTDDPEVKDYDGDGTLELPSGAVFQGDFQFTTFFVPHDVLITTTGPLSIKLAEDSRIFGVMRLGGGFSLAAVGIIDNRTSAWLAESDEAEITFSTALKGSVDKTMTVFRSDRPAPTVPPVKDTDGDGVPNSREGNADFDKDGFADSKDQDTVVIKPVRGKGRIAVDLPEGAVQRLDFCNVKAISDTNPSVDQQTKPQDRKFPYGLIQMDIVGLGSVKGRRVTVTFRFPSKVPADAEYWAYREAGGWYRIPIASHDGGKTITLLLKDKGNGDADGKANGVISGPGGLAVPR